MDRSRDALRGYFPGMSDKKWRDFDLYYGLLREWNQRINLTTIVDEVDVYVKHFVDSLLVLQLPEWATMAISGAQVVDVGSGAGFPGVPLAMVQPDVSFTLCDSLMKRLNFLEVVASVIDLSNVRMVHARAEDLGHQPEFRGLADGVVARSVAPLSALVELCLPLLRVGGRLFAYKGPGVREELQEAQTALSVLGGQVSRVSSFSLPLQKGTRFLVVVDKIRTTGERYPRQAGTPQKRPLMNSYG